MLTFQLIGAGMVTLFLAALISGRRPLADR
jgi:hypothetical protein